MNAQSASNAVDDVNAGTTWEGLSSNPGARLIDVRTKAEWSFVGVPDLGSLGKRTVLVEWQTFPDQGIDPRFAEKLDAELRASGAAHDDPLYFICRSGSRSLAAARAMAALGYNACHNVAGGFEGPLDQDRRRGSVDGWKAAGLPWIQS